MKPYYEDPFCKIYHGDNREILPTLGGFDLCLTDPPYGLGESSRKKNFSRIRKNEKISATDYGDSSWDNEPASRELIYLCRSAAPLTIIWGGNYFHLPPAPGWLVWDKLNSGDFADCELAWTNLPMSVRIFRHMWNGMIRAGEARGVKRVHPTQKPLELMTWCLSFAPDAKTIIDPFAGSCTTLVAAKQLGRQAVGIELDERYCEIGACRLQQEYLPLNEAQAAKHEQGALV